MLVVEELAHRPAGHYPNRFMELAEGFADCGCHVETLTARGWRNTKPEHEPTIAVRRYGRASLFFLRLANRLRPTGTNRRALVDLLRCMILVRQVRRATRRMGTSTTDVVVVGAAAPPSMLALVVRSGTWIVHAFNPGPECAPWITAALARRSRRRQGACAVTIVVPTPEWTDSYRFTGATVASIPLAGIRRTTPIADARAQLGLEPGRRIALLFGAVHNEKDGRTVADAFRSLPDWQLLVVGRAAARPEFSNGEWEVAPIAIDSFVDSATRSLAFEAADAVILSFVAHYRRNSGTFMDAMSHGVPVVVSSDSLAADLTEEYGVGVTFTVGDAASLRTAMGRVPTEIDPTALATIHAEMSNEAVARAHLALSAE